MQTQWLGPYAIYHVFDNGTTQLTTIDPIQFKLLVNGHRLRLYHKPQTKAQFLQQFQPTSAPPLLNIVLTIEDGDLLPIAMQPP